LLGEWAAQIALTGLVDARAEAAVTAELARGGEAADLARGDRPASTQLIPGTVSKSGT
jgi:hypothetical protein